MSLLDTPADVDTLAGRVDAAHGAVQALADEASRDAALELHEATKAFSGAALAAMVQRLKADERGRELLFELVDDPVVLAALTMHGIVRPPLQVRVQQVLDHVRPYLQGHGGDVELVRVERRTAFVRLTGACQGCGSAGSTLRDEVAGVLLEHLADLEAVEAVEDVVGVPGGLEAFIPIEAITVKRKV